MLRRDVVLLAMFAASVVIRAGATTKTWRAVIGTSHRQDVAGRCRCESLEVPDGAAARSTLLGLSYRR